MQPVQKLKWNYILYIEINCLQKHNNNLKLTTPAYCWFNNDTTYKNPYGALYNWHTIGTGKLAPVGWRVSTDGDWKILLTYLGGDLFAGGKLKESGLEHWNAPNAGATNETGFTGIPGSIRYDGEFLVLGICGHFWTATDASFSATSSSVISPLVAYNRTLSYNITEVSNGYKSKHCGLSVRCIME